MLELDRGPRPGDQLEVEIARLDRKAMGVATLDAQVGPQREHKRYTLLVRKALPGERVRVEVERSRRRQLTCHVVEILEASPSRITPRCPHFGRREVAGKGCGGCSLQMISYDEQLAFKQRTVARLLADQGLEDIPVRPIVGVDEPWYYRNKMEFSFGDNPHAPFALGMHPIGYRHDVLALEACHIQSEFTSAFLPRIRDWAHTAGYEPLLNRQRTGFLKNLLIREGKRTGERLVELVTTSDEVAVVAGEEVAPREAAERFCEAVYDLAAELGGEITSFYWTQHHVKKGETTRYIEHLLRGEEVLREELHLPGDHRLVFEIHPRAFFQTNTLQAEVLYTLALEAAGLLSQGDERPVTALDLYCGTGTLGLCMAPYVERVAGIDINVEAVENARKNAADNGIEHATFFAGDVGKVLATPEFREVMGDEVELVIVDPPRAGLFPQAREQLGEIGAPRLVYISCNPAALARDLADLTGRGYAVRHVQPVDMFPHTYHVESVALLELEG